MKKIVILMLLCTPMMVLGQTKTGDRTKTSRTDSKEQTVDARERTKEDKTDPNQHLRANENLYVAATVSTGSNGQFMVKMDLAQYRSICQDKSLVVGLDQAKSTRYNSIAEFMNEMEHIGFEIVASYTNQTRVGNETVFLLKGENRMPQIALPTKGEGNTMSRENPAMKRSEK